MTPAPCGSCRLSPCHRRAECPKYRKWEKIHKAESEQRIAEIKLAAPFAERSIKIKDKFKKSRRKQKWIKRAF